MKTIGSQKRETLKESGLRLHCMAGNCAFLFNPDTGHIERWVLNNHYAGYVIEIYGDGYEFVSDAGLL